MQCRNYFIKLYYVSHVQGSKLVMGRMRGVAAGAPTNVSAKAACAHDYMRLPQTEEDD